MKFMNLKRFASTVMAGVMALSLAVPASAASITITGTYEEIEIAVEVPTTGTAQVNPYGLPVTIDKSDRSTATISGQQIVSEPMSLRNQSEVDLAVNASLLVLPVGEEVSIAAKKDTNKAIAVTLQVASLDDSELAVTSSDRTLEDKLIDKFADNGTWSSATELAAPTVAAKATTGTAAKSTDNGNTSPLATLGAATAGDRDVTYAANSIALFRLAGDLAESPQTGSGAAAVDNPWKTTDGFSATIVFTFKPVPAPTQAGTLTPTDTTINVGTGLGKKHTTTLTLSDLPTGVTVQSATWTSSDDSIATVAAIDSDTNKLTATATAVSRFPAQPLI